MLIVGSLQLVCRHTLPILAGTAGTNNYNDEGLMQA